VVLPDADAVDVPEATGYVVTDDGTLAHQAGGSDLLRLPVGGWLQVGVLDSASRSHGRARKKRASMWPPLQPGS
jgi:hypothetical protein